MTEQRRSTRAALSAAERKTERQLRSMSTIHVGAAALVILLGFPAQAADILNRGLDVPLNCPGSAALSFRLGPPGIRLDAEAAQETRRAQSPSAGRDLGIVVADSRDHRSSLALDDNQLDNVAAGLAARATGDAQAEGAEAGSTVEVITVLGQPGPQNASSIGQAAASASGTMTTGPGVASSSLTLTVTVP